MNSESYLALEDGRLFRGFSLGAAGIRCGEAVFNTAMSGYQEILSDPSYSEQIICFSSPHIGNTGINTEDHEADRPLAAAMIVRHMSPCVSNWRSHSSLPQWLQENSLPCLSGIDTRALTRHLSTKGSLKACLVCNTALSTEAAIQHARQWSGLEGRNLAQQASRPLALQWREQSPWPNRGAVKNGGPHVVILDLGAKANMARLLVDQGCRVTIVPADTPAGVLLDLSPEGILLSNGPGDPAACKGVIQTIKQLLQARVPLFGICLGHQLLALACGAQSWKMPFGHHGANHPVRDLGTGQVWITSQNHGFAVAENLPESLRVTHRSLFDDSIQGIRHTTLPAFGFQGHPEASPGPQDALPLFKTFVQLIQDHQSGETC